MNAFGRRSRPVQSKCRILCRQVSAYQMRLLVLMRQSYADDNPRPVIEVAMPVVPKADAYATPWLMGY